MIRFFSTGGAASRPRPVWLAGVAVLLALGSHTPRPAGAHGQPAELAFWGNFGLSMARCQREIGRAGASCARQAWRIRRDCRLQVLAGGTCDTAAADAAIEAIRRAATDRISPVCSATQVQQLRFVDVREAQSDVIRFCRELDNAVVSAVFRSLPSDASALSATARACIGAAAQSATALLNVSFRSRQRLLDRIAQRAFPPRRKTEMVAASSADIAARASQLEVLQGDACPAPAFTALYGLEPAAFLTTIASRADCLAGDAYAQAGVLCPAPTCGNGMREPGEDCDDANTADGDGCPATCLRG